MIDTDYLQSVPILRLQSAARRAGLAFRNGDLNKAGLIDRLTRHPMIGGATVAILKREGSDAPSPVEAPQRKVDPIEWMDESEAPPAPAPSQTVGELFGDWRPRMAAAEGANDRMQRTLTQQARMLDQTSETVLRIGETASATSALVASLQAEIADLKSQRPIELHLKDLPPVQLKGKTHRQFPDLLAWLHTVGRVILTGPAGTGKSRAAAQCAEALGLPFYLQTPFTQSYEYLGHRDASGEFHSTPTFKAYTQGGVLLLDEADSSAPDAFLAANPILDGNGFAMFGDGELHKQHPDFYVILNMNTQGDGASLAYTGRNPLDGATIARFGGMLHWAIDPLLESGMADGETLFHEALLAVRDRMAQRGILTVNATPRHVLIGARLLKSPQFSQRRSFILESCLKNGPLAEVWSDVLRLPAVSRFLQG